MKNIYLLILSFSLISCYTYKTKAESEQKPQNMRETKVKSTEMAERAAADPQFNAQTSERQIPKRVKGEKQNVPGKISPSNIQDKLEVNKYFKIDVGGKPYKIQVDKWDSDTLVAHVIHKPKKILKFHKNQIDQSTIAERRFSNPTADIITVVAYASIGVGIYLLVK